MANTGDIPNNITLGASQTVRRNAGDTGFEAFTPSGGPHAILSTTHTDTLVDSVVRGDLIVGNATPKWARLPLGGSAKSFVTRDANDVIWSTGLLDVATGKTLTVNNSLVLSGTDGKSLTLTGSLTVPVDGTAALGAGTLSASSTNDVTGATHTHAITGSPALLGNGSAQYQTIITGATPFAPTYSGFLLDGTTGGKTVFAVTNTKTLTLTATDSYNLTIPATGTAALLGTANVFTENQTISSTAPALVLTDTTASAKSLTIAVDANKADFRESAGAAGSLLQLDLANNRVGIGVAPSSIFEVQGASPNPIFRTASTSQSMTVSFYETSTLKGRLLYAGGNPASFKYFGFINDAADYLVFYTLNNTPIYFYPNNALSVTFEAGGNVALVNKITTYNNVATEGYGVGAIVDDVALTNQGADIGSTNFTNAGTAGTYLLSIYFVVTTLDAAAGTVTLNFAWNDGGARTLGLSTLVLTSTGYFSQTLPIKLSTGSISYNTTHTGSYGTSKYALYMSCIRLS